MSIVQRKRTSSFSVSTTTTQRPTKSPRTMGLRRTESYIVLPTAPSTTSLSIATASGTCRPSYSQPPAVPYQQSLQYYKDQRQRRKAATRASLNLEPITFRTRLECTYSQPLPQPVQQVQRSPKPTSTSPPPPSSRSSRSLSRTPTLLDVTTALTTDISSSSSSSPPSPPPSRTSDSDLVSFHVPSNYRASSPLSPKRYLLPARPVFPRSKPEPDLYRRAITTCMRCSPEGQKILRMGPRLALSILTATQELEKIVAEQENREDVVMEDRAAGSNVTSADIEGFPSSQGSAVTRSWVDFRNEDWEMVDCSA